MTNPQFDKMKLELRRGVLVLAVLASLREQQYGYSLRKLLQQAGVDIDEGTLYPLIRRLNEQGLLDSEWQPGDGRERRYYQLSELGAELLQQLSDEWSRLNAAIGPLLAASTCEGQAVNGEA